MGFDVGEGVVGEVGEGERGVDNGWRLEDWLKKKGGKKKVGRRTFFLHLRGRKSCLGL